MLAGPLRSILVNPNRPTWVWDFARYGRTPPGTTYTGSGGTFVGSNGLIQSATTNVPRFDYDPVTGSPLGYLAEMASTNLCLRSEALDNASWTTESRVTVTANAVAAPDGATTADKIIPAATNTYHIIYSNTITVVANAPFGASIFVKAAERSIVSLSVFSGSTSWIAAAFDLSSGTNTKTGAGAAGSFTSASIRAMGNGWYRIAIIGSVNATSVNLQVEVLNTNNPTYNNFGVSSGYTGNASDGLYAWGGQFEASGVGVTSYIPTAGSTVSRAQDVLSLPLTSLPGWSATQGGVLVAAYRLHTIRPGLSQGVISFSDVAENNILSVLPWYAGASSGRVYMYSGGGLQSSVTSISPAGTSTPFFRGKMAAGWSATRGQGSFDGGTVKTVSGSYSLPASPTNLYIGADGVTGGRLNGTLESIAYYRGARSDAFVQAVSR